MAKVANPKSWELEAVSGFRYSFALDEDPPSVPGSLLISHVGNEITVEWGASTDVSGISHYVVERSLDGSTGWVEVGTPTELKFIDSDLELATAYHYRISAVDNSPLLNRSAPSVVVSDITEPPAGATPDQLNFPRLGAVAIGGSHSYDDPASHELLAQFDFVILGIFPNWHVGKGMSNNDVVLAIKALSVRQQGTLCYLYTNSMVAVENVSSSNAYFWRTELVDQHNWWLYLTGTSGEKVATPHGHQLNVTHFVSQVEGQWMCEYLSREHFERHVNPGSMAGGVCPALDGFFEDNIFWNGRRDGDYNRDGTTDLVSNETVRGWWREGRKDVADTYKALMPGKYVLGNLADWYQAGTASMPNIDQEWHGGVLESIIGASFSVETWSTYQNMQNAYKRTMDRLLAPKMLVFDCKIQSATDYQLLRYCIATCLMGDGWFGAGVAGTSYDTKPPIFEEYTGGSLNAPGYLGQAVGLVQTAPWSNGVWRREFANGWAYANPKSNGQQVVSLGGTLWRLRGSQAGNTGVSVTEVTLPERDGIILLKSEPPL